MPPTTSRRSPAARPSPASPAPTSKDAGWARAFGAASSGTASSGRGATGRAVLRRTRSEAVLVTRGSRGMALFQPKQATVHIPIVGSDEVADVTGAGDTVIATFALALAAGGSFHDAARLANFAGGLVVMK